MGILSALIVGPCVAAPLAGALIYIGQTGNAWLGGLALFIMSFGMGIPLIIIGISAGHWLPRAGEWMTTIKAIFGVMLLATAIWMLDRIVPKPITLLLTACLLIIIAIYLGALDSLNVGISGWRRLWKGVGLILLIYGILLMIGAMSGNNQLWQPLLHLKSGVSNSAISNNANSTTQSPFKYIKGLDELEQQLALAKTANKPVLLDFYADWCVSCEEMEVFTFSDAEVQKLFTQFILLKTDVTANDEQDKSLYKRFNIYGPPAIVFFDQNGLEITAFRLIGFIPVKQFRQHLLEVLQQ
jgi:thiol:disulfide interchange protein DsbD